MEARSVRPILTVAVPEWKVSVLASRWGCPLQPSAPAKVAVVARKGRAQAVLIDGGAWGPELAALARRLTADGHAPSMLLIGPSWRRPAHPSGADGDPILWGIVPETAERSHWEAALKVATTNFARFARLTEGRRQSVRAPVAAATAVLMRDLGIPEPEAYARLRTASMRARRPLVALAEGLLRDGGLAVAHRLPGANASAHVPVAD